MIKKLAPELEPAHQRQFAPQIYRREYLFALKGLNPLPRYQMRKLVTKKHLSKEIQYRPNELSR